MSVSTGRGRSPAIAILCVVLMIISIIAAVYYWTQQTSFLAGNYGIHHKHAALFTVLAVVFLLGAVLFRPRRSYAG